MVLKMIEKAHVRNAFNPHDKNLKVPIKIKTIYNYLEILKNLYDMNISFQLGVSSIADIIPSISTIILSLKKIKMKPNSEMPAFSKQFCSLLIQELETRAGNKI